MGSPPSLPQTPCRSVFCSIHFKILMSPEELVCFCFPVTMRTRRLGIIACFALVARKLRAASEPCLQCVVIRLCHSLLPWPRFPCMFYHVPS